MKDFFSFFFQNDLTGFLLPLRKFDRISKFPLCQMDPHFLSRLKYQVLYKVNKYTFFSPSQLLSFIIYTKSTNNTRHYLQTKERPRRMHYPVQPLSRNGTDLDLVVVRLQHRYHILHGAHVPPPPFRKQPKALNFKS